MIFKLLGIIFEKVIGSPNISKEKKEEYRIRFRSLLSEIVKSAAEGAVKGVAKGANN